MKFVLLFVFTVVKVDGAFQGESCDSLGDEGVCINLGDCPSALEDLKHRKPPITCSSDGNNGIIVCCRTGGNILTTTLRTSSGPTTTEYVPKEYDYETIDNRRAIGDSCKPIPAKLTSKPTGQKAWDKCLEYQEKYIFPCEKGVALSGDYGRANHCHHNADELIIGGKNAAKWEFPHMVLLGYMVNEKVIVYQCGGALISERFVLTAGHCISDQSQNNVSHALIGILKRSEESASNRYGIKRVIKHDKYQSPNKYHDIALLELDRVVKLDHSVVPACLHTGDPIDDSKASAAGWGTTVINKQSNSDVLQKVIVTKFPAQECSATYPAHRHMPEGYVDSSQTCYGDRTKSQDTCQGDSGGPLHVKSKKIVCMYTIIGVTSFGQECGLIGVPGIYTRVSHYLPWIERIVWPN